MNNNIFVPYTNINVKLQPATNDGATSKNVLLIGQRNTSGVLTLAKAGYTQPNYYVPFLLPSFSDGLSALQYLANFGIKYTIGYGFSLPFSAPDIVNHDGNGNTIVGWNIQPYGFNQLMDFALSGTLVQGNVNGTVIDAYVSGNISYISVVGNVAYINASSSGTSMTLNGNNNVLYPDPNNTDPIALMVWSFYQSALIANQSTDGAPQAYISITSNRDSSISPTATAIALSVPTTVTVNGDGSVSLGYTHTTLADFTNFGYLPTTTLGNTTISQAGSDATGTYAGYTVSANSSSITITILVTGVTGTFDTVSGDVVSVVLDVTQNAGQYLNGIDLDCAVLQQPINNLTNITTTHADFYSMIANLNSQFGATENHFGTFGIAGNITNPASNAQNLPSPNNPQYILTSYPYVQKFGNIPYDNTTQTVGSGRLASTIAYFIANGDAPYPPLTNAILGNTLPVSSIANITSYSATTQGSGNIAITRGWLPIAVNNANVPYFLQSNTTMTTLPGTNIPDTEFRYTHPWKCIKRIKKAVTVAYNVLRVLPNNQGTAILSPLFVRTLQSAVVNALFVLQKDQIVQNVSLYQQLVSVVIDANNANQVDIFVPSQIIPQLNGANITINVFSALYNFNA